MTWCQQCWVEHLISYISTDDGYDICSKECYEQYMIDESKYIYPLSFFKDREEYGVYRIMLSYEWSQKIVGTMTVPAGINMKDMSLSKKFKSILQKNCYQLYIKFFSEWIFSIEEQRAQRKKEKQDKKAKYKL